MIENDSNIMLENGDIIFEMMMFSLKNTMSTKWRDDVILNWDDVILGSYEAILEDNGVILENDHSILECDDQAQCCAWKGCCSPILILSQL